MKAEQTTDQYGMSKKVYQTTHDEIFEDDKDQDYKLKPPELTTLGKQVSYADDFEALANKLTMGKSLSIEKLARKIITKPSPKNTRQIIKMN